ncbi:MAG: DUF4238 domain-containing protein, partial [Acidobacteriota bacterium]|nr:DUF4238 domain-containing protein [Acidobacteriota bacterium]
MGKYLGGCEPMPQVSRDHHFLSQGYLAAFTDAGTKEGRLCVLDLIANRFFRQTPKNVAFEVDFNRIEIEGVAPDALEAAYGQFEDKAITVIRRICNENRLPRDEDFSYVYNFIALLRIRNPNVR